MIWAAKGWPRSAEDGWFPREVSVPRFGRQDTFAQRHSGARANCPPELLRWTRLADRALEDLTLPVQAGNAKLQIVVWAGVQPMRLIAEQPTSPTKQECSNTGNEVCIYFSLPGTLRGVPTKEGKDMFRPLRKPRR